MGLLGEMRVAFTGDVSGLRTAAGAAQGILSKIGQGDFAGAAVTGLALIAGAAIGVGVSSVKAAANFQQSMLKVQAYAGLSAQQTKDMSNSILDMAAKLGQSPKAMADAIYPIISSGYSASQALNILDLSAKTAAASGAKMSVVADMLTTSLKASGAPASQAGHYMDMFNKIVALGKGEVPAYAATIGKLTLAAGGAHVPFDQMGAALATLTTHGFPSVAQASNSLGNLFTQIGPKVDTLAAHAKKLGLNFNEDAFKSADLSGKLKILQDTTHGNDGALLKLLGGSTLAKKAFDALTKSGKDLADNMNAMKNSAGATDAAYKTASSGFNASVNRMKASVEVLQIRIGQALLPELTKITDAVGPLITQFADWLVKSNAIPNAINGVITGVKLLVIGIQSLIPVVQNIISSIQNVYNWFVKWRDPIMATAYALAIVFGPAMIKAGIQATISGAQIAAKFVTSMIMTGVEAVKQGAILTATFIRSIIQAGIEGWASVGKIAMFIGSMAATGTAAVVNAAKVTASFVASMVATGVKAAWAALQVAGQFVVSLVRAAAQALLTAASFVASLIPAIIAFIAQTVIAVATAIPGMIAGLIAWAGAAWVAAAGMIAATWPILLIIIAIAALIVIIVLLATHWKQVTQFIGNAMSALGTKVHQIVADIGQKFSELGTKANDLKNTVGQHFSDMGTNTNKSVTDLGNNVLAQWNKLNGTSDKSWGDIGNTIMRDINIAKTAVVSTVSQMVTNVENFFTGLSGRLYTAGQNIIINLTNGILSMGSYLMGAIGGLFSNLGGTVHGALHGAGIPGFATGVRNYSGLALVGESGPELVNLGGGDVYKNSDTRRMLGSGSGSGGGTQIIYVQLDGQTIAQAVGDRQAKQIYLKTGRRAA